MFAAWSAGSNVSAYRLTGRMLVVSAYRLTGRMLVECLRAVSCPAYRLAVR